MDLTTATIMDIITATTTDIIVATIISTIQTGSHIAQTAEDHTGNRNVKDRNILTVTKPDKWCG